MTTVERLFRRAETLAVPLPDRSALEGVAAYYDLLQRWNATINLTSLRDDDEGLERLVLEPLIAARHLASGKRLLDIGSGGGSPAIPLAVATGASRLGMIESRGRKAAFLREACRTLALNGVVYQERVEHMALRPDEAASWDIVSARGIRLDAAVRDSIRRLLAGGGTCALFHSPQAELSGFQVSATFDLLPNSQLSLAAPV